jgi:hypothetical protein
MNRNSTIIPKNKLCKCGCGRSGRIWANGMLKECNSRVNPPKPISKFSKKRESELEGGNESFQKGGGAELQRWFEERHKELKGVCSHCGGRTEKGKSSYKCPIAHILPKSLFKSVATHERNFIELCFYGKSCHSNYDNHMIDLIELNCFNEVIEKFVAMYPSISPQERRRIPQILLDYLEVEK